MGATWDWCFGAKIHLRSYRPKWFAIKEQLSSGMFVLFQLKIAWGFHTFFIGMRPLPLSLI